MCYHKSLVEKFEALMEHYSASFASLTPELELIREEYSSLMMRDQQEQPFSKLETSEVKSLNKGLSGFTEHGIKRYHENGFDYLPTPIITAGAPEEFKLFRWGLIPFYMKNKEEASEIRFRTLNCISEEMYEKSSFRDAAKNAQRCLIPISGFMEWKWMDENGKEKRPYFIQINDQPIISLGGLYSRWKDKLTDKYYYSYAVLTTEANPLMAEIHNSKKRMPVIIPKQYEKDWLNKNLTRDDVLALCRPIESDIMNAHTISKHITKRGVDTNVEEVLSPFEY